MIATPQSPAEKSKPSIFTGFYNIVHNTTREQATMSFIVYWCLTLVITGCLHSKLSFDDNAMATAVIAGFIIFCSGLISILTYYDKKEKSK